MQKFRRVAVGISGGVDSAVSALILKTKGYEVIGTFMRNWDKTSEDNCDLDRNIEDAQWICQKLNIPFKEINLIKEYWANVFEPMVKDYSEGLTPNPDIRCNSYIKFDPFFHHCREKLDVDAIATGHYARSSYGQFLENYSNKPAKLLKGTDDSKDQTFFLSKISQETLQRTMFPVGDFMKTRVREIAQENCFGRIARKKESMGICFIGKKKFQTFISQYVPEKPGRFIDIDNGDVLGKHNGIHLYTIGQRSKIPNYAAPHYVAYKDISGDIYVAFGSDHPSLFCRSLILTDDHWIVQKPESFSNRIFRCKFRFLHRKPLVDCSLLELGDFILLNVDEPIYAATPGQFAVFYDGDECLGSAKISFTGITEMFAQDSSSVKKDKLESDNKSRV